MKSASCKKTWSARNHFLPGLRSMCTLLYLAILFTTDGLAQKGKTPTDTWIFPGISYQTSPATRLLAQFGLNQRQHIAAVYVQAFVDVGRHITLNHGYLYFRYAGISETIRQEHDLTNAVIIHFSLSKFLVDDRNLLWNRFMENGDFHYYRNRLRITWPIKAGAGLLKIYAFDELSYFFNKGILSRNRLAVGCGYDLWQWFNLDVFFSGQNDVFNGRLNWLFIQTTFQLHYRKKENKK